MTKKLLVLAVLLLVGIPAFAQSVDTAWVKLHTGSNRAQAIAVDASGKFYVIGERDGTYEDHASMKTGQLIDCGLPGDVDGDTQFGMADFPILLNFLYKCLQDSICFEESDGNGNCEIDLGDFEYLRRSLFSGGPPPIPYCSNPDPFYDPGQKDTLRLEIVEADPGSPFVIPLSIFNDDTVGVNVPLSIEDTTQVVFDSIVFAGTRGEGKFTGVPYYSCDGTSGAIIYSSGFNFAPGTGISGYLWGHVKVDAQPGFVKIDTSFLAPTHQLRFFKKADTYSIKPEFVYGGVIIAGGGLDCAASFSDPCLTLCPLGDIDFTVTLRNSQGYPIVGHDSVWLDFSDCSGLVHCDDQDWPIVYTDTPSDLAGQVTFHVKAGGCDSLCTVDVKAPCGIIQSVPVRTLDLDGDLVVELADSGSTECHDYDCDGLDYDDETIFEHHTVPSHTCDPDPCLYFWKKLTASPDTLLDPGDTTQVCLYVKNKYFQTCSSDSVNFFHSGFGLTDTLIEFSHLDRSDVLDPGDSMHVCVDYVLPDSGDVCFFGRIYPDCCPTFVEAGHCLQIARQCSTGAFCYEFQMYLDLVPVYVQPLNYTPQGWLLDVDPGFGLYTSPQWITVDICTDTLSSPVDSCKLTLFFCPTPACTSPAVMQRTFEVRISIHNGDVDCDCIVGLADVVYMINYILKAGPEPCTLTAADVNCSTTIDLADVVYLINYLFNSGPPPC